MSDKKELTDKCELCQNTGTIWKEGTGLDPYEDGYELPCPNGCENER
ncbi:MAG: hypothetical protein GY928_21545 [Colwellia sp.]|nr:hypothetical protein [Colwellia sp.]